MENENYLNCDKCVLNKNSTGHCDIDFDKKIISIQEMKATWCTQWNKFLLI